MVSQLAYKVVFFHLKATNVGYSCPLDLQLPEKMNIVTDGGLAVAVKLFVAEIRRERSRVVYDSRGTAYVHAHGRRTRLSYI